MPNEPIFPETPRNPDGFTRDEINRFGEALVGTWSPSRESGAPYDQSYKLSYGNTFDRLGIVISANYENGLETRAEGLLYVYGPGTGFDEPIVTVNVDNRGYDQPSTLYLYWQNRSTGDTMYYNLHDGLVGQERDLFGAAADGPARVLVPDLTDFRLFGPNSALTPAPP